MVTYTIYVYFIIIQEKLVQWLLSIRRITNNNNNKALFYIGFKNNKH